MVKTSNIATVRCLRVLFYQGTKYSVTKKSSGA